MLALALVLTSCQTGSHYRGIGASGLGFAYISELRSSAGLTAMTPDNRLEQAAISQAAYMAAAGKMAHTTGLGRDFTARMRRAGVEALAAENLAHGRMEPKQLFSMWMASQGHRVNILNPRFSRYGLAYAIADDGQRYWALVLGQ